jgi:hypothetical protein
MRHQRRYQPSGSRGVVTQQESTDRLGKRTRDRQRDASLGKSSDPRGRRCDADHWLADRKGNLAAGARACRRQRNAGYGQRHAENPSPASRSPSTATARTVVTPPYVALIALTRPTAPLYSSAR